MIHAKGKWAELSPLTRGTMKSASEIVVRPSLTVNAHADEDAFFFIFVHECVCVNVIFRP